MKQYLEHLKIILEKGIKKPAERNSVGTTSLFGYQWRHNLADGFPLLTTKRIPFRWVVVELLWFLRGDTNIKYLLDNGINIWNGDAYNYFQKKCKENGIGAELSIEEFIGRVKEAKFTPAIPDYTYGDCGFQYGRVWRDWYTDQFDSFPDPAYSTTNRTVDKKVDQITNLINNLKNYPMSRRHILTSIDPAHDTDLALYWCHALTQFNCRPLTLKERQIWFTGDFIDPKERVTEVDENEMHRLLDNEGVPKYYLDCQMYQRSADMFLGVSFNVASYALLTHIFAKILNMVPGEMVYSYGDSHIYDNHMEQVKEQLSREPYPLSRLSINDYVTNSAEGLIEGHLTFDEFIGAIEPNYFTMLDYKSHAPIKGDLTTN